MNDLVGSVIKIRTSASERFYVLTRHCSVDESLIGKGMLHWWEVIDSFGQTTYIVLNDQEMDGKRFYDREVVFL